MLHVVFNDVGDFGFILTNHHPEIPFSQTEDKHIHWFSIKKVNRVNKLIDISMFPQLYYKFFCWKSNSK